ncbi:DUF3750 domain-containing protein [Enterovirga rhinocerotis]|uniref:Uncharacterized protein DUF3750 n=1 Tax=Enterovirga rhinocerotis TaxID=1339210 RepID=A0A4R7C5T3_9HYPH|nr:DUF3750 domain-containing protein [Enterovirga rhinocerotis]TDR93924.1 uncharacterized protein DUF3750 [Enterovirga rhinocerotis]
MLLRLLAAFLILFILPLATHAVWWSTRDGLAPDWRSADWSSARILPQATAHQPALIRIYAARTGRWKGIFAHHSWIVIKPEGAARYARFDKVGWGSPVRSDGWPADARWFGNTPDVVLAIDGAEADRLIPKIAQAIAEYPYRNWGDYRVWPGPNSNTFVAFVVSRVPELQVALPPTALGKDFHAFDDVVGPTPSHTGFQVQLGGFLGLAIGWVEGIEMNVLGLVTGLDIRRPALKLPGWGRIGMEA